MEINGKERFCYHRLSSSACLDVYVVLIFLPSILFKYTMRSYKEKTPSSQINENTIVIIALLLKTMLKTKIEPESKYNFCKLFDSFSWSRYSSDTQHKWRHKSICSIETTWIISWLHVLNSFNWVVSRIYCFKTKVWFVPWDKSTSLTEVREIYCQAQQYCP